MAKVTVTVDNSDGKLSLEAKKAAFAFLEAVGGFPETDGVEFSFLPPKAVVISAGGHGSGAGGQLFPAGGGGLTTARGI